MKRFDKIDVNQIPKASYVISNFFIYYPSPQKPSQHSSRHFIPSFLSESKEMKSFTAITTHSQLFYQTFLSLRFKKHRKKQRKNKAKQNKKRESRNPTNVFALIRFFHPEKSLAPLFSQSISL